MIPPEASRPMVSGALFHRAFRQYSGTPLKKGCGHSGTPMRKEGGTPTSHVDSVGIIVDLCRIP